MEEMVARIFELARSSNFYYQILSDDELKAKLLEEEGINIDILDEDSARDAILILQEKEVWVNNDDNVNPHQIDTSNLEAISLVDSMGVLRDNYLLINNKPDKNGLLKVLEPGKQVMFSVHPTRVKRGTTGSISTSDKSGTISPCPECGVVCGVVDGEGVCLVHGNFNVAGEDKELVVKKAPELVDLIELSKRGELWIKLGKTNFDHANTKCTPYCFRYEMRQHSFQLYNGSFGKKGNKPPIDGVIAGNAGHAIDNLDKWKAKMEKEGYTIFKAS